MKVKALVSTFIGHGGQSVWLGEGDEHDHNADIVKANPDLFTEPVRDEPQRRGGALRRG